MEPPSSWAAENVAREAWLSVVTRPVRALVAGAVVAILLGTVFGMEVRATNDALADSAKLDAAGRYVFRARPTQVESEPVLDRGVCDRLVRLDQIDRAGGLTDLGSVDFRSAPKTPLRVFEATGTFANILDESRGEIPQSGALISAGAARVLGFASETVELSDGRRIDAQLFAPGQRHPSSQLMVLLPTSADKVQECWFSVRPGSSDATVGAVRLLLTTDAGPPTIGAIQEPSATSVDPLRNFEQRPTRLLWIFTGAVGGLLLAALTVRDREQIALSRVLGATYLQTVGIGLVQIVLLVLWVFVAIVVGGALLFDIDVRSHAFRNGMFSAAAAGAMISLIGVVARYGTARESVSRRLRHGRE